LFFASRPRRRLHPFPTRRSSDLLHVDAIREDRLQERVAGQTLRNVDRDGPGTDELAHLAWPDVPLEERPMVHPHRQRRLRTLGRSEEHTSELQSRVDLVCRLLLE